MRSWWRRRSLKIRLTTWFTVVSCGILLGLAPLYYWLIEHRLRVELDHQLTVDWNLVQAHLEPDANRGIRWKKGSPAGPDSAGYADTWFDVRAGRELLLKHWPSNETIIEPPPTGAARPIHSFRWSDTGMARAMERPTQIGDHDVILRVFRDESGLHRTLREILMGLLLAVPLVALFSALGGYFMAGRTLQPISAMTEKARQITSDSLGDRLPNPNPHDELGQLATVFNETLQRLQRSFESLRQFTADASHELRTPLTALRAEGEVALRNSSDPGILRETLGSMLEEAQHLNDLTDSLLMLARADNTRWTPHLESVSLGSAVEEIRDCLGILAAEKRQALNLSVPTGLNAFADRTLLRQALMNVVHNSIRYSPPKTRITIECSLRENLAVISVADEGPGIAPEHQHRVFDRFYRIEKSRSRQEGGVGLGLAIAKVSVERMGGTLRLESRPGFGSRFELSVPVPATR